MHTYQIPLARRIQVAAAILGLDAAALIRNYGLCEALADYLEDDLDKTLGGDNA